MSFLLKKQLLIALVIVAIPVLAVAWWLLSPLFIDKTVEEEFPMSAGAEMPAGVTQSEAEKVMSVMAKIDMTSMESMPAEMPAATVLASGMFRDGDSFHKGSGDASLYRLPDGEVVLRFENLNVTNGPDLHVLVTPHSNPESRDELHDAGYTDLGQLKGNRGNQNYELPAGVDPDSIGSVIIYCMPFHVIFSVASLDDSA